MKSNKKIKELIKLSEENPELEIIPFCDSDIFGSDDFAYILSRIGDIAIDLIYEQKKGERVIIGNGEIYDYLYEMYAMESEQECSEFTNDEVIKEQIEHLRMTGEIKEIIIVYIRPY
jgi:hypothetical protein